MNSYSIVNSPQGGVEMIPLPMKQFLQDVLPESVWKNRLITDGPFCFLEFGPLDVDRLQRLGIRVDRLGPRLVVCMWHQDSPIQIGGFLVVDNLAMGQPSMGGTRMRYDITPDIIHNLARGMTLKNAAADLPFGGGKSGIVCPEHLSKSDRHAVIRGFGQLLKRYKNIYIPGPDVGTNDADMKTFAIENGLNNVVSKPSDMGGNRIDELGGAANGIVVATRALLEHLPKLRQLPQFKNMEIPLPQTWIFSSRVLERWEPMPQESSMNMTQKTHPSSKGSVMPMDFYSTGTGCPGENCLTCGNNLERSPRNTIMTVSCTAPAPNYKPQIIPTRPITF